MINFDQLGSLWLMDPSNNPALGSKKANAMWRQRTINLFITLASVLFFIGAFEGILTSGMLDNFSIHWIPEKYKEADESIQKVNADRALRHPFTFNGPIIGLEKKDGSRSRIVVLGDSFVWGKGLPYEQGWTRKLGRIIAKIAPGVEVVEWARNGWSTAHEFKFLEDVASNYGEFSADLLVVAFVVNDLDLGDRPFSEVRKVIVWQNAVTNFLRFAIPNTVDFFTSHVDAVMEVLTTNYGYKNWVEYLWSGKNITRYKVLLGRLKAFLDEAQIPLVFALTPATPNSEYYEQKFKKLAGILDELEIPYIDLFPRIAKNFPGNGYGSGYRKLWANPADSHPGSLITSVLAEGVAKYLTERQHLQKLMEKPRADIMGRLSTLPVCGGGSQLILRVAGFDQYQLLKGRDYVRIQGIALENVRPELKVLESIYVRVDDTFFPTLSRLPLNVVLPNGRKKEIRGWFAVDLPIFEKHKPAFQGLAVVTKSGCKILQNFGKAFSPRTLVPPVLSEPPQITIENLLRP